MSKLSYKAIESADSYESVINDKVKNIKELFNDDDWKNADHNRSARFQIYNECGLFNDPNIVCIVQYSENGVDKSPNVFFDNGLLLMFDVSENIHELTIWNGYTYSLASLDTLEAGGFIDSLQKAEMAKARKSLEAKGGNGVANLYKKGKNNRNEYYRKAIPSYDSYLRRKYGKNSEKHKYYMSLAKETMTYHSK